MNNVSRVDELNPLILPFLNGEAGETPTTSRRASGSTSTKDMRTSIHGGYGITTTA